MRIAWSKKVTNEFLHKVLSICDALGIEPDYLMSCMAFESAETFSPSIKNAAGSGAVGLIQFMPKTCAYLMGIPQKRIKAMTLEELSVYTEKFRGMTAVEQLDYVEKYFRPYKGKLKMLSDVYMAILFPRAVGKPEDYVLFNSGEAYRQNSGLDNDRDGQITKAEAASKVYDKYIKGLRVDFVREFLIRVEEKDIPELRGIENG